MANNLQKKPFLDYQAQIKYLKQKQLVINDEVSATTALEKVSYYGLINGYKDIFKDPATNSFYPGTTFEDIYNLYLFDAELRDVFLKYILIFEKHVKSSISYHFSDTYGNGMAFYRDINNYDYGNNLSDVQYLFHKILISTSSVMGIPFLSSIISPVTGSSFSCSSLILYGAGARIRIPFSPFLTCLSKFFCQALNPATNVASGFCIAINIVLLKL